jgi:transposase
MTTSNVRQGHYAKANIAKVIAFLRLFMPETLAKRIICIVLLAVGIPSDEVAEIAGFCDKTVKSISKNMSSDNFDSLFMIRGGGRKGKLTNIEKAIVDEVENGEYHSKQQVVDMIQEKHGLKTSLAAVGRLLKKTRSGSSNPVQSQQKQTRSNNASFTTQHCNR